jgi:hypothetical protein
MLYNVIKPTRRFEGEKIRVYAFMGRYYLVVRYDRIINVDKSWRMSGRASLPNLHAYYGAYLYLPTLVCVEDQRSEKPNHLHKVISWHACQAY